MAAIGDVGLFIARPVFPVDCDPVSCVVLAHYLECDLQRS